MACQRLVEVLKQDQYTPMPVAEQIIVIYAGNQGLLDETPLDRIRDFEKELLEKVRSQMPELLREIAETKEFSDENKKRIDEAIASLMESFK